MFRKVTLLCTKKQTNSLTRMSYEDEFFLATIDCTTGLLNITRRLCETFRFSRYRTTKKRRKNQEKKKRMEKR